MRRINGKVWLVTAGVLAGCQPVDTSRPPTVRFGEEACASCRMIISDERFAAALITATGDALKFDDIGCLIQHEEGQIRSDVNYWVRSFRGQEWLKAHEAMYLHGTRVTSPMGHGLAALPATRATEELAATDPTRRILRFRELPGFLADPRREAASDLSRSE
jgi:copper chaperone NosL